MARTALHRVERRRYFSSPESRRAWIAIVLVLAWCSIFYLMRQPQTPFAFDLPQAQTNSFLPGSVPKGNNPWAVSNAWLSAYPTSLVDCGSAGSPRCSNYCDQNSLVRYTECNAH